MPGPREKRPYLLGRPRVDLSVEAIGAYLTNKVVLVSTDKAVRPANVMGASKRMGEMIPEYDAQDSECVL